MRQERFLKPSLMGKTPKRLKQEDIWTEAVPSLSKLAKCEPELMEVRNSLAFFWLRAMSWKPKQLNTSKLRQRCISCNWKQKARLEMIARDATPENENCSISNEDPADVNVIKMQIKLLVNFQTIYSTQIIWSKQTNKNKFTDEKTKDALLRINWVKSAPLCSLFQNEDLPLWRPSLENWTIVALFLWSPIPIPTWKIAMHWTFDELLQFVEDQTYHYLNIHHRSQQSFYE